MMLHDLLNPLIFQQAHRMGMPKIHIFWVLPTLFPSAVYGHWVHDCESSCQETSPLCKLDAATLGKGWDPGWGCWPPLVNWSCRIKILHGYRAHPVRAGYRWMRPGSQVICRGSWEALVFALWVGILCGSPQVLWDALWEHF